MITVYGRANSSNVQAVMWGLTELGLEAERLDYGHVHGGTDTAEFRAMSPHGLVPVLRDGDLVVWESCAILRYLAARYGGAPFWPGDPAARAPVDMWAEWGKTTFSRDFTQPIFWAKVRTPASEQNAAALALALERFDRHLGTLDAQLEGRDFVAGVALTLADIVIGHVLYRYFDIDVPRREHARVGAYYERLAARPAYARHVMISYDALRAD